MEWVKEFFIRNAELYVRVLSSEAMLREGEDTAVKLSDYLSRRGLRNCKILDVGSGVGRVAIPLAKLGFKVIGIDISQDFINEAIKRATREGVNDNVVFLLGDARELSSVIRHYAPFNVTLFMFTTVIGYYDYETDLSILRQVHDVSGPGSLLIIDTVDKEYYINNAGKSIVNEIGDHLIIQRFKLDQELKNVKVYWSYYIRDKDKYTLKLITNTQLSLRIYSISELRELASRAGWNLIEAYSDIGETPYKPGGRLLAVFAYA
ncbi:class I SAM-dependent methyltransferase [Caldivirga maquilingensis]|uniref:Arsenite methyltransferase n=1 Tax=Caldivirga maquilingensis (strain ATCC 700844 / DSM 13496 / JCM 10307 / IC-167) TaxID=397948 RepID=A8M9S1_CALMQ|nr:class I SAM-dependent methyltransferase [Caldivirga maquilingensis]ABW00952.1 Methyltransferase type 11 [Caldivirga maquilingensis IC-167]